jgi:hypothetical protein
MKMTTGISTPSRVSDTEASSSEAETTSRPASAPACPRGLVEPLRVVSGLDDDLVALPHRFVLEVVEHVQEERVLEVRDDEADGVGSGRREAPGPGDSAGT